MLKYLFVILWVSAGVANLAWSSDFHSPRTAALGGAGHAGPMLNDSVYLNPSFASFLPTYSLGLNYGKYSDGTDALRGHHLNLSVQDGRSEVFQAGVGFTQYENRRFLNVGASRAFIQKFGVGVGGKFLLPKNSGDKVIQDMIFSTSGPISKAANLAVVVDNLLESAEGRELGLYREFILGTKLNLDSIVLVYFDPHWVPSAQGFSRYGFESGLEFPIMQDFFLRLGAYKNASQPFIEGAVGRLRARGYGLGLGWIGPRMSFDWGLSRVLEPIVASEHVFGMTLYF